MAISMQPAVNIDAHITHVESEGILLKIYAQTEKQNACYLERLLYQLKDFFDANQGCKPKNLNDLKVGLVCCAKFDDTKYYRARIEHLNNFRDLKILVSFIDYGNNAFVNVTDIRLIGMILNVIGDSKIHKFLELPGLAHEYYLAGIAPKDKEWDMDTLDLLRKKLCNVDLKCSTVKVEEKTLIKILNPDCDPANLLISLNKAFPISIHSQERAIKKRKEKMTLGVTVPERFSVPPPPIVLQQPPPSRLPNITQPPPVRMMSDLASFPVQSIPVRLGSHVMRPGMRRQDVTAPPATQSLQFSTEMLAPGVSHPVYVSHVEDGPLSFAVQLQSVVQEVLVQLMADLNNHNPQPITAPLNPGSICLGRYSLDNSLCRAIVMNVLDDKAKLYFADFGTSEILPYSEIFQIPPQFVAPKVMSHRFTLANIKDVNYTDQEKKLFKDLVANSHSLLMKVTPPEANPLKQYCELFLNCKNIKQILTEITQSQLTHRYAPLSTPIVGSQEKVFVSFVLNPGRFFVQLEKNSFSLKQIMSCVANHCRTAPRIPLHSIRVGECCCALYEDNKWYRAEIMRVGGDKACINFVDYGNQEEVQLSNLRQTTPELITSVKAQAIACCLSGYEISYNVDEEVANRLEELILEKRLMMHVIDYTSNVLIAQLLDEDGQDIKSQLEMAPSQSPIYNNYQATAAPSFNSVPAQTNYTSADDGWTENQPPAALSPKQDEKKYSDTKGPSDDKKSWRSRDENDVPPRFSKEGGRWKDGEDKPWNKGDSKFNKDDNWGGRGNKDSEDGGGRFNRDATRNFGDRSNRFNNDDRGGRFNRDSDSRGGGRFNDDRGNRFNKEDGGARYNNRTDDEKPWRKNNDDSGGWRSNKEDGGTRGGSSKGWRENDSSGSWKDGGGDRKNRFDSDSGFKRGGGSFNRDNAGDTGFKSNFSKPWDKGSSDSYGKSTVKSPKPDTVGGMPNSIVKVGMTENTQVVYTKSPVEFYVQLNSTFEELNQLMEKIASACESGEATDMTTVQEKTACLAKYSEDEVWYRAYVEETSFDSAKVLFVDYGNQEDVPFAQIKNLPEDMSTLPVQAVKCRLFGVPETAEVEAFTALVQEKTLVTQYVEKHFLTKSFQIVMVDEESGCNINTAMGASEEEVQSAVSKLGMLALTPAQYPAGSTITMQMTWYLSPSQFYLQPMASNAEFRAMMQSMQSVVRSGVVKQNNQLNPGDFVIAKFKMDKVLYRGLVKEVGFSPTVQYVDYGNTEAVDSGSVWAMETEYATLPMQALSCCLAGVQPTGDAWPKADTTGLDQIFDAETLECTIVNELPEEPRYVVSLSKNGEDVAQKIIEAGFAVAGSDAIGASVELDTSLLVGQLLPVVLLRVENQSTFFVQAATEDAPELQSLEAVAGEGIKCTLSSVKEDATEEEQKQFIELPPNINVIILVDAVQTDGLQVTLYDGDGKLQPLQLCEVSSVGKICPLPILNTHQRIWIAHASDEGIFLHKTAFGDLIADLLQKLYEFYNESEQVEQEWTEGELCCAKSVNDEQWYRAKIVETGPEIKVQYVDYGNCETIPVNNIRQLDSSFYTPHALALKSSLHVSWIVPVENLLELTDGIEYNAVVLRTDNGWLVELVDSSGQSLTEKLVELGFASALENSPFKRVVEGGRFVEGSDIPVSISFIDSPLQLWILVGDDIELIEALQDRLQETAPRLPLLKEPTGIFAAKFSDGLWYRALKLNDSTVRFIDYGNSDEVDMSDIKALSPDFLEPAEGYAVKVELPIVDFKVGATERLEELTISSEIDSEEEIIAHILSVKDTGIVADILKGGKSVVDILVEENLGTRLIRVFSGFISHLNSLNDFFVQEVGCEEALTDMASSMVEAESFEQTSSINKGDIVAALYTEDALWYRAKVLKCDEAIEVLFIDYGNSAVATDFRILPPDVANKPNLSKHCALNLPVGVVQWSESANEKFIEMSADGCTQFDIKVITEEDPATVSLSCNGNSVIEELKPLCDLIENQIVTSDKNTSVDLTEYNKTVYISHINSPNDFYVQHEGAETELDTVLEEFLDVDSFEPLEQITEDLTEKTVGAFYDDDNQWYRAKIIKTEENQSQVLFVDYGNSAVVTKFVKIPETLENKIPLAIHCALSKEDWPEEATSYLNTLSCEGTVPFKMKVLEEGKPNIVSLIVEENIVEKELASKFLPQLNSQNIDVNDDTLPKVGESKTSNENKTDNNVIKTVYLIQVNSPSNFFLHTAEATQLIDKITERLTAAEDFLPLEETEKNIGNIVAAQIDEDDLWYRARILDLSENETKVLFIDYGNTAKVAKMKTLPEDLVSTPPLAMPCSLQMLGNKEWSVKACETFNKLANDDGVTFDLRIISEGDPALVALYINGESVAEQLIIASGLVTEENVDEEREILDNFECKTLPTFTDECQTISASIGQINKDECNDNFGSYSEESVEDTDLLQSGVNVRTNQEKDIMDPEKDVVAVEISHFNSSSDFFVQLNNEKEELVKIMDDMTEWESFETTLDVDEILAAKYTCDDLWYRAKILETSSSGSTVLFVDYGNTDVTSELRKLPKNLAERKPLAKHCCLKSTRGTWTESTDEKLSALAKIGGFTFDMKILEEGHPCTVVDLYVAGKSLMETFSLQEIAEEQTNMGELILQSVEDKISDNTNREIKKITDELIFNAVSSSNGNISSLNEISQCNDIEKCIANEKENKTAVEEQSYMKELLLKSVEEKISDNTNSDIKEITDELILNAVSSTNDNMFSLPETPQCKVIEKCLPNEEKNDTSNPQQHSNELNSINSEVQEEILKHNENDNTISTAEQKRLETKMENDNIIDVNNESPHTPRRINIDEHIVPGCISSVKLLDP